MRCAVLRCAALCCACCGWLDLPSHLCRLALHTRTGPSDALPPSPMRCSITSPPSLATPLPPSGRVDDVINVSGHRIGTAEVESALVAHPQCAEAAVVGYEHPVKGQGIWAYVTLLEVSRQLRDAQMCSAVAFCGPGHCAQGCKLAGCGCVW